MASNMLQETSTVTEESVPNTSNRISNTDNYTDQSHKKLNTEKKLLPNAIQEPVSSTINYNYQSCENPDIEERPPKKIKTEKNVSSKDQDYSYENFVLWEKPDTHYNALNILEMSAAVSGITMKWKYSKIEEGWECSINFDSQKISCSTDIDRKVARQKAAISALEKLKKRCYMVKVKEDIKTKVTVTTEELKCQESLKNPPDDDSKVSSCIGENMMKMMGWTGGGLGKFEQGIVEPMSALVKTQINREGLGMKKNSDTEYDIKSKCRQLFKDLLRTKPDYSRKDIVFLDFPEEDRLVIHQYARIMGLKSFGRKNERKVTVSSKIDIWSLVRELNNLGGVTEKYELVKPTDEEFISLPTSTCM